MAEKKSREERTERGALAPWRPFAELDPWEGPFSSKIPRLMDELFREWPWAGQGRPWLPAVDVSDDDQHYTVTVELPGTRKEDVHVELQDGTLTIRGEKKSECEEKKERRRYVERCYGSFSRSFRLPPDADADRIDASFKEGVLTLTIAKTEEAKPRAIAIKE